MGHGTAMFQGRGQQGSEEVSIMAGVGRAAGLEETAGTKREQRGGGSNVNYCIVPIVDSEPSDI